MGSGPPDRAHDVLVAGTPAQLPGNCLAYLGWSWIRTLVEQRPRRDHHPRSAETALQPVFVHEPLLDRVELPVAFEALDRAHGAAVGHGGQDSAALHRHSVHGHHAYAAIGGIAPPVRSGQPELVAEEVHKKQPGFDLASDRLI